MSLLRDLADALVRPGRFFEDRSPSTKRAASVVLVVALLSAGGLVAAGTVLGGAVPGTATVENPEHRSGYQCEKPSVYREGGVWEDKNWTKPRGCTVPPTMQVDLGGTAKAALIGAAFPAFVAVVLGWLLATGAIAALAPDEEGDANPAGLLGDTGWAFLPLGVLAVLRPLALWLGAAGLSYPNRPAALANYVRDAAFGTEFLPLAFASVACVCWTVYVLVHAVSHARGTSTRRILFAVGGPTAAGVLLGLAAPPADGSPELFAYGLLFAGMGLLATYFPRGLIMLNTRFELFGMRGRENVEPADWYVALHRFGGVLFAALGFFLLGGFRYVL